MATYTTSSYVTSSSSRYGNDSHEVVEEAEEQYGQHNGGGTTTTTTTSYRAIIPQTRTMTSNMNNGSAAELDLSESDDDGGHAAGSSSSSRQRVVKNTSTNADGSTVTTTTTYVTKEMRAGGGGSSSSSGAAVASSSSSSSSAAVTAAGSGVAAARSSHSLHQHATPPRVRKPSEGDEAPETLSPSSAASTKQQDETIGKLRVANQALRKQLKEFSRALGAVQQQTPAPGSGKKGHGPSPHSHKGRLQAHRADVMRQLSDNEKKLKSALKKLEIYKKTNAELKKQMNGLYNPEKLAHLESEKKHKEVIIKQLHEENRSLLIVQRNQTKRIEEQESQRSEWPAKVSSLMADLRVAKDKLRKAKEKEARVESSTRKQHEALVRLQQKNKHLQEQLAQHERGHGGRSHGDRERHKLEAEWREEKAKLERAVALLERSKAQERTRGERLLRENVAELQKVKAEMERHKAALDEKSKEIRLQMLQVKKLRRQLRELALGGGGSTRGASHRSTPGDGDAWDGKDDDGGAGGGDDGHGDGGGSSRKAGPRRVGSHRKRGRGGGGAGPGAGGGRPRGGRHVGAGAGGSGPKVPGKANMSGLKADADPSRPRGPPAPGKANMPKRGPPAGKAHYPRGSSKHDWKGKDHDFHAEGKANYDGADIHHKDLDIPHHKQAHYEGKSSGYGQRPANFKPHFKPKSNRKLGRRRSSAASVAKTKAASTIQRAHRRKAAKARNRKKREAATRMQSVYRGHAARRKVKPKLVAQRSRRNVDPEHAAVKIQAAARGRAGRAKAKAKRNQVKASRSHKASAAEQDDAARMLQSLYRGHNGRQEYAVIKEEKVAAAHKIQALGRGHIGRTKARRVRGERARERAREFAGVTSGSSSSAAAARKPKEAKEPEPLYAADDWEAQVLGKGSAYAAKPDAGGKGSKRGSGRGSRRRK